MTERAVKLREATWLDAPTLRRWRNHPQVRRMMGSQQKVGLFEHVRWMRKTMASPDADLLMAFISFHDIDPLLPQEVVGTGRIDYDGPLAYLSVTVSPIHAGRHIGRKIIELLVSRCRFTLLCAAEIRIENTASIKAFTAAGFRQESIYPQREQKPGYVTLYLHKHDRKAAS